MKTPTRMHRSSTWPASITPSRTESTTARATAACAGPNICTAWVAPLIVTLLDRTVSGFAGRFGATTARRFVCPSFWFTSASVKASPTGPSFDPMMRSMWATSLPSPTSDSPTMKELAICASPPNWARPGRLHAALAARVGRPRKLYDAENAGQAGVRRHTGEARGRSGRGGRSRTVRLRARGERGEARQHHAEPRLRGHLLRGHAAQRDRDRARVGPGG